MISTEIAKSNHKLVHSINNLIIVVVIVIAGTILLY